MSQTANQKDRVVRWTQGKVDEGLIRDSVRPMPGSMCKGHAKQGEGLDQTRVTN